MISPELDEYCKSVRIQPCAHPNTNCPWTEGNEYRHFHQSLCIHREILDFARWIQPTIEENQLRFIVINKFRNAVRLLWPKASILCHGSSATKTYLPNGDIDFLVINTPQHKPDIGLLQELNSHFKSLSLFKSSLVIKSAKCPIIKGTEKPFGFQIDISINNTNGVLNIQRNKNLMQKYPTLYPLLLVLKFFLLENNLDKPYQGGISSNTLQQMIIFIIQSCPPSQRSNLGSLLYSFFQTFGVFFNYITTGISTRNGGFLFSRLDAEEVDWKHPVNICVEDPQIPGLFIGENAFDINTFRNRCFLIFNQLKKSNQNEQSILMRFIHKPEIVTKSRKSMKELYDSVLYRRIKIEPREDRFNNDNFSNKFKNTRMPFVNANNIQVNKDIEYRRKDKSTIINSNERPSFKPASSLLKNRSANNPTSDLNRRSHFGFQKPLPYKR